MLNDLEAWKEVDLQQKRVGCPPSIGKVSLTPLYSSTRPINLSKLKDLKSLLWYIPPIYHAFYTALESSDGENTDE